MTEKHHKCEGEPEELHPGSPNCRPLPAGGRGLPPAGPRPSGGLLLRATGAPANPGIPRAAVPGPRGPDPGSGAQSPAPQLPEGGAAPPGGSEWSLGEDDHLQGPGSHPDPGTHQVRPRSTTH